VDEREKWLDEASTLCGDRPRAQLSQQTTVHNRPFVDDRWHLLAMASGHLSRNTPTRGWHRGSQALQNCLGRYPRLGHDDTLTANRYILFE
jgi:hypothetical protein